MAGWSLPTSATDGPGVRTPTGVWSCFAHTQSGAVLSAYTIALLGGGLAQDWRTVVQQQTMPGPGQGVLLGSVPNTPTDMITTPRGFDIAAYTADRATVRYRLAAKGQDYACTLDVQWSGGDWRLVLADDGGTSSAGCVRGVPDTFTPWGPS